MDNPYKPELKKIIYYRKETEDTFTIRLDWKLKHGVGQFVFCSVPGIGEAPISICSYSDNYVELNIRMVGNVTSALSKIRKGHKLLVRGAYGTSYPMRQLKKNNLIIIGGGCGVAPLKGLIEYVEKNRKDFKDISLYFGFRSEKDTLFANHISRWKKDFTLHCSFDKTPSASCSIGTQGFITGLVDENIQDNGNKVAMLCGPPIMIEKTIEILKRKGFNDNQIFLSARLMYCGLGRCGRCMIHGKFTCLDGPVFRYDHLSYEPKDA